MLTDCIDCYSYSPSYDEGPYDDVTGTVVRIDHLDDDNWEEVKVTVRTEDGELFGWIKKFCSPGVGYRATVRAYRAGGGWYPDDLIIYWKRDEHAKDIKR